MSKPDLPWARWWHIGCPAVREQRPGGHYWGRCELARGHDGDHALDRGYDVVRWSTDWTQVPAARPEPNYGTTTTGESHP